jgi:hypothetical protein
MVSPPGFSKETDEAMPSNIEMEFVLRGIRPRKRLEQRSGFAAGAVSAAIERRDPTLNVMTARPDILAGAVRVSVLPGHEEIQNANEPIVARRCAEPFTPNNAGQPGRRCVRLEMTGELDPTIASTPGAGPMGSRR